MHYIKISKIIFYYTNREKHFARNLFCDAYKCKINVSKLQLFNVSSITTL